MLIYELSTNSSMKISRNWLQTYFKEKLPSAEKMAELFTFHAFEVEGIESVDNDEVVDVKVLPDRAHDCLSYQGIAREFATISGLTLQEIKRKTVDDYPISNLLELDIKTPLCRRNIKAVIQNVEIKDSPNWLKERLETIGQRAITNVVDATNYVMFDVGQPLHAFDFDKLEKKNGKVKIVLRNAKDGEKITLLGGKELTLTSDVLVFADGNRKGESALDIAGVKGGRLAEVDEKTKNLVMLADNFDPVYLRKTAHKLGILTEASKRFENDPSVEIAARGMAEVCDLIKDIAGPKVVIEGIVEYYPEKEKPRTIEVSVEDIHMKLGATLPSETIENILKRFEFSFNKKGNTYAVTIPVERKDLVLKENLIEEIGRIYGYDKLKPVLPPKVKAKEINKTFYWSEKIKDILVDLGYSGVYTYVLTNHGEVEIQNPLASDKGFLRNNLKEGIEKALIFNARNAPLLGQEEIKLFELGTIFTKGLEEYVSLSIGYCTTKSVKNKPKVNWETLEKVIKAIGEKLGVELRGVMESSDAGVVFESDFSALVEKLPEPTAWDIHMPPKAVIYKPFSLYPFVVRDISFFVPGEINSTSELENVRSIFDPIIINESNNLILNYKIFDMYVFVPKGGGVEKTSLAFRLIFQSKERTLTDDEVNAIMKRITDSINSKPGWQVR